MIIQAYSIYFSYLSVAALKVRTAAAGREDAEVLVAGVQAVGAVVAHRAVRHALPAARAPEGGRGGRQRGGTG